MTAWAPRRSPPYEMPPRPFASVGPAGRSLGGTLRSRAPQRNRVVLAIAPTVVLSAASLLLHGAAPALHSCPQLGPRLQVLDAHEQRLLGERKDGATIPSGSAPPCAAHAVSALWQLDQALPGFEGRAVKWRLLPL